MSFVNQGKPARIKSVYGHNTGTTTENVYTCPANCTAEITFIHVVNGDNSTNTVEVGWYVAADTYVSRFLSAKSLGGGEYISFNQIDLVLQPNDQIRVTPTGSGHIDTILTVTETFVPVG